MPKLVELIRTNHPHIVQSQEICRGSPVIEGTRMRIIDIVIEYTMLGWSPDEIVRAHPHINLAEVHDALSYYYERKGEIDTEIQKQIQYIEELKLKFPSKVKDKLDKLATHKDIYK